MPIVDSVIKNAKDSRYTGQSLLSRMSLYTSFKTDIARLNLDDAEYTQAIRKLANALGV